MLSKGHKRKPSIKTTTTRTRTRTTTTKTYQLSVHSIEYFLPESCVQQGTNVINGNRKVNQKGNLVNPGGIPSATRY